MPRVKKDKSTGIRGDVKENDRDQKQSRIKGSCVVPRPWNGRSGSRFGNDTVHRQVHAGDTSWNDVLKHTGSSRMKTPRRSGAEEISSTALEAGGDTTLELGGEAALVSSSATETCQETRVKWTCSRMGDWFHPTATVDANGSAAQTLECIHAFFYQIYTR